MTNKNIHAELDNLISVFLSHKSNFYELEQAVINYQKLLLGLVPDDIHKSLSEVKDQKTFKGIALNPDGAINCLDDTWRVVKFVKGINSAIINLLDKFPNKRIHIAYAGCGPLAPLIIPSCKLFTNDQIKVTLIDINQKSLDSIKKILSSLELMEYVNELVCADAAQYEFSSNDPIHIIISETMYSALYKEGQVAISYNLGRQLIGGGFLIPEEILISAVLIEPTREFELMKKKVISPWLLNIFPFNRFLRRNLGKIFALNLEKIRDFANDNSQSDFALPDRIETGRIKFPKMKNRNYQLMLTTRIKIFEEIILEEYESGLTYPMNFSKDYKEGDNIQFYYELSDCPQFKHHFV